MIWALAAKAADNHPTYNTREAMMAYAKVRLGHAYEIRMPEGIAYLPKSIAFDAMDHDAFQPLCEAFLHFFAAEMGVTPESLWAEVSLPRYITQAEIGA